MLDHLLIDWLIFELFCVKRCVKTLFHGICRLSTSLDDIRRRRKNTEISIIEDEVNLNNFTCRFICYASSSCQKLMRLPAAAQILSSFSRLIVNELRWFLLPSRGSLENSNLKPLLTSLPKILGNNKVTGKQCWNGQERRVNMGQADVSDGHLETFLVCSYLQILLSI